MTRTPISPRHRTRSDPASMNTSLLGVIDVVAAILDEVSSDRIELITFTRDRISLQPADLAEGQQIARVLGLDSPLDHRMFVPGHTLWIGEIHGLEAQVRSVLRQPVGAAR